MSTYQSYHLAGDILSLALIPEKREAVEKKLRDFRLPWSNFISTGSNHLILPSLYLQLKNAELLSMLPDIVAEHLEKIYSMNLERNKTILAESQEVAMILGKANVPVLFMKGMGNIFDSLYISPGERMLQDIDILTDIKSWENGTEALINAGFKSRVKYDPGKKPDRKHYPRLFRDDSVASVELHRYPVTPEFFKGFRPEEVWEKKVRAKNLPSSYVMCDEHKIIHNFIHSQLEHHGHFYARIFLRNLYDQFLLSRHSSPFETLSNWNQYPAKTHAYLEILRTTFFSEKIPEKVSLLKTGFYPLRFKLFLRFRFLNIALQFADKIYWSFIKKPVRAIKDKELRQLLIRNLADRKWYKKQLRIFKGFISRSPTEH